MTEQRKPGAEDLIPRQGHSFTIKSRTTAAAAAVAANTISTGSSSSISSSSSSSSSSRRNNKEEVATTADTVIIARSPLNAKSNSAGDINTDEYVGGELLNYHDMSIGKL